MIRRILWFGLSLGPLVIALDAASALSQTFLFALAVVSLVPLAWLIGEATEHLAEHTGPGIGGFLNATFGNAPELIIALVAVTNGQLSLNLADEGGTDPNFTIDSLQIVPTATPQLTAIATGPATAPAEP